MPKETNQITSGLGEDQAVLVGRLLDPASGHFLVARRGPNLIDITSYGPTMADFLERPDRLELAKVGASRRSWDLAQVMESTDQRDTSAPHLISPIDLQVIKAAGVTFAASMLERIIEEQADGDPAAAQKAREETESLLTGPISGLKPGSPEAAALKEHLKSKNMWSQYLEVGLGPDAEIFTKAPVLSSVGTGAQIGVLRRSEWNNPEPELVLVVSSGGHIVGATLGNDVNLRDIEGRSALLLSIAKDNNASCAIGPMIRLIDDNFGLNDVRELAIDLTIRGTDGFELHQQSSMSHISRDITDLVRQAHGDHHQYPDGFVLFTGTLFAPTDDRDLPGLGFTHREGDEVLISSPSIGVLKNVVGDSESSPQWVTGIRALYSDLAGRNLIPVESDAAVLH